MTRLPAKPRPRSAPWVIALGALLVAGGCSTPCVELADRTCKRAGDTDSTCKQLRAVAQHPSEQDLQACRAGQAFLDDMEKR